MISQEQLEEVLRRVMQIGDGVYKFDLSTPMLGSMPEFDSMAVVSILLSLEETFGLVIDDEDVTAEQFATIGSLLDFVNSCLDK